jgi:hypothetical protein
VRQSLSSDSRDSDTSTFSDRMDIVIFCIRHENLWLNISRINSELIYDFNEKILITYSEIGQIPNTFFTFPIVIDTGLFLHKMLVPHNHGGKITSVAR